MSSGHEAFKTAIESFKFYKEATRYDQLLAKSIPVSRGDLGFWLPLTELHTSSGQFTQWLQSLSIDQLTRQTSVSVGSLNANPSEMYFLLTDHLHQLVGLIKILAVEVKSQTRLVVDRFFTPAATAPDAFLKTSLQCLFQTLDETLVPDEIEICEIAANCESLWSAAGFSRKGEHWLFGYSTDELGTREILTAGPTISGRESEYVLDACRYGWNNEWSKYIKKFEQSFAQYIGVQHALSTSSCTGALHIALTALGVGPGDEVIVPEITWVATASAVRYVGATPVFAEVDRHNWCLDVSRLEGLITKKTKCIMPVHTYGHPCDMDEVMRIANRHGLYVVEDAAPAIGAECRGRKVGSYGHFSAFSFQGAKMLVTGEGGMLLTNDPELYKRAYSVWDHGRTPGTFWINEIGYKYKMANILAALGLAQLERVNEQIRAKRRIANWYQEELGDFEGVRLWRESEWARSIYWMSSLTMSPSCGISRDQFFSELKSYKIDTRPAFPAISSYPMWESAQNPIANEIGQWGVNLPSGVLLKEHEVRFVARTIRDVLTKGG